MIINFGSIVNIHLPFRICLLPFILILAMSQQPNCTSLDFRTTYTKCLIKFDQCPQISTDAALKGSGSLFFRNCQVEQCQRLGSAGSCLYSVGIELDQAACYAFCCKDSSFDAGQCRTNDKTSQARAETINSWLVLILTLCILVLLITIICFAATHLRCFENAQTGTQMPMTPSWLPGQLNGPKCNACGQNGVIVQTSCKHCFCIVCFRRLVGGRGINGQCFTCDAKSQVYRLWCEECQQKYIKMGVAKTKTMRQLQEYYAKSKQAHTDCAKDAFASPKTEGRLTVSTKD